MKWRANMRIPLVVKNTSGKGLARRLPFLLTIPAEVFIAGQKAGTGH
jgi:hypothetical protein